MISFPLSYLLIPFGVVFLVVLLFFFFNVFHLRRYGVATLGTTALILVYLMSFVVLVGVLGAMLLAIDWQREVTPADFLPSFNSTLDTGL